MRALVWRGPGRIDVEEVPRPSAKDGWAIVDVTHAGVCGTDLHIWAGDHPRASGPLTIGHEFVGRLARDVDGFDAGTPVAIEPLLACGTCEPCRRRTDHVCDRLRLLGIDLAGGVAEQVLVPVDRLVRVPEGTDLRRAAFVEPLAVAVHAVRRSGLVLGDRVLVLGGGPIGLAVGLCAQLAGAAEVFLSEPSARRRTLAETLGLTVLDPADPGEDLRTRTGRRGADITVDAAAHPDVARQLARCTATRGRIVIVGTYGAPAGLDLQDIVFRELEVLGCRVYSRADFEHAVELIASGRLDPAALITSVVPLDGAVHGLGRLRDGEELKLLIELERSS